MPRTTVWPLLCVCGLLAGCGKSAPALFPVVGKVLVEGRPVKAGTVQFRADAGRGNKTMEIPVAEIQTDGTFELQTGGQLGAPPGWYRVLVVADNFKVFDPPPSPEWPKIPKGLLPRPLVNERYLYFNQTDLLVCVVEDPEEDAYVLQLKP